MHKLFGAAVMSGALMLSACSGGGGASGSTSTSTTTTTTSIPAAVVLSTSLRSLKSDGSDSATITAAVVDKNNLAVGGATVKFTSNSGQLGTSSGISSSTGAVTIPFSAGTDPSNRTEVITATVSGTTIFSTIPIKVLGSTLTLSSTPKNNSTNDVSVAAVAKDVSGTVVGNQEIRFSFDTTACTATASCGSGTLSASSITTDVNGSAKVTLTPSATGPVTVTAEWYNSSGASTYSVSTTISVVAVGTSFSMTFPEESNAPVALNTLQAVSVAVPSTISGMTVTQVRLATTLGQWSNQQKTILLTPVSNAISEILNAGNSAGIANIQIDALAPDPKKPTNPLVILASLNRTFVLSAPASQAGTVSLQPSVSNVAPSTGGTTNTATLTATVRTATKDADGNPIPANAVGGAPVLFEIVNSTGSGEQISPVLVYTNGSGQATTTFTSGSQSTIGGLQIKATVLSAATSVTDTKTIFVNATGVSVTLGRSSTIDSTADNSNYELPMSVLVVDNAGTAVSNALVTLSAFPTRYYFGYRAAKCAVVPLTDNDGVAMLPSGVANEDINENDILDPGEDQDPWFLNNYRTSQVLDGLITPPHATAGTVPSTVATDSSGVATFKLTYQKTYASWVRARIRAKVVIATGTTESTNELQFILPISALDAATDPCPLGSSPWNP